MTDTVHLSDLRCDGSAHAGCQAGCLLFWKEAWLVGWNGQIAVKVDYLSRLWVVLP
jgi:hypothetical protein